MVEIIIVTLPPLPLFATRCSRATNLSENIFISAITFIFDFHQDSQCSNNNTVQYLSHAILIVKKRRTQISLIQHTSEKSHVTSLDRMFIERAKFTAVGKNKITIDVETGNATRQTYHFLSNVVTYVDEQLVSGDSPLRRKLPKCHGR